MPFLSTSVALVATVVTETSQLQFHSSDRSYCANDCAFGLLSILKMFTLSLVLLWINGGACEHRFPLLRIISWRLSDVFAILWWKANWSGWSSMDQWMNWGWLFVVDCVCLWLSCEPLIRNKGPMHDVPSCSHWTHPIMWTEQMSRSKDHWTFASKRMICAQRKMRRRISLLNESMTFLVLISWRTEWLSASFCLIARI